MEICKLPDKEFKIIALKEFIELQENRQLSKNQVKNIHIK